jgi:hypothetical protein
MDVLGIWVRDTAPVSVESEIKGDKKFGKFRNTYRK